MPGGAAKWGGMKLIMSQKERDRLGPVRSLDAGEITQRQAAQQMGITERQVRRVLVRYRDQGDAGLVHKSRGQPSNRRFPEDFRKQVVDLVAEHYADFGPTFAAEKLAEHHGLQLSKETLRRWMNAAGLRQPKPRKARHRTRRPPRECCGELLQVDGSIHAWFEERGPEVVLISAIDDATKRLYCRFAPAETTEAVMRVLGEYIRAHGRPLAVYADLHSIYRTTRNASVDEQLQGREAETQMGRALRELGIEYIASYSPQGKGRVERAFGVLQDRLLKELRLADISDIDAANDFLERVYLPAHNERFTRAAACASDAHRPADGLDLGAILSHQESRTVTNDYTISYYSTRYQIARESAMAGLRGAKVTVEQRLDGSVKLRFRERYLTASELPSQPAAKATVDQRRKRTTSRERATVIPAADHPWRRDYREMRDGPIYP